MNSNTHRFNWLNAKRITVAIALMLIAAFCVPALTAQIAPVGAVIGNQASATYTDTGNITRTAFSNLVQTTVTQVWSGTLVNTQSKYAVPGTQVYFPHTFTNTGNGPDSVNITAVLGSGNLSNIQVFIDANGDGIPDNTTNISGTNYPVAANGTLKVVVAATLTAGAASGGTVTVTASDTHFTALTNTDTVTLSNNGVVSVTKAMTSAAPGGTSTVTLTYTNTGNAPIAGLTLTDAFPGTTNPTNSAFLYVAGTTKWNGVAISDNSTPTGFAALFNPTAASWVANIGSVALPINPGVTGTITYNVTVPTPTTFPATLVNTASYTYNDLGTSITSDTSTLQTNTVNMAFTGYTNVKFNSGTATYNQGNPAWASGQSNTLNTTPDTSIIPTATYNQGATITWTQVITNTGQLLDTYNLTLDTTGAGTALDPAIVAAKQFPAGTTFTLYRQDGKTPLTDSNGDGVVDSGPLTAWANACTTCTTTVVVTATLPPGTTLTSSTTYIVNLVATSTNATASNFATPGIQDVVQEEVIITKTTNAGVDLTASSTDTAGAGTGTGTGVDDTTVPTAAPGKTVAIPFYVFNTGVAADAFSLNFAYLATGAPANLSGVPASLVPLGSTAGNVPAAITVGTNTTIPAWTVQIAPSSNGCTSYGAPVTSTGAINYTGTNSAGYCLVVSVPQSYTAGEYVFNLQAQSNSTGAIDQMEVAVTVSSVISVSISPNNQGTIYAGGTMFYKHVITNSGNTDESALVELNTPTQLSGPTGWIYNAYSDNGSGGFGGPIVITGTTCPLDCIVTLKAGTSVAYWIEVQAPGSANPGDQQITSWTIALSSGTNTSTSTQVLDTTTVISGEVRLTKSVYVDTSATCSTSGAAGAGWASLSPYVSAGATATHSNCLVYKIAATVSGTPGTSGTGITNLVVSDTAPPYTALAGGAGITNEVYPIGVAANAGCGTTAIPAPVPVAGGATGSFTVTYPGPLPAGCEVDVYFKVQLN